MTIISLWFLFYSAITITLANSCLSRSIRSFRDASSETVPDLYRPASEEKVRLELLEHSQSPSQFALAREEKFQGFEQKTIVCLLHEIDEAVYNYDREVCWTKELLRDGDNNYIENPLKEWQTIDPGHKLSEGSEWFKLHDYTNITPTSHQPITAALKLLLSTPNYEPLVISSGLEKITFSQVHMSLIYWFILDILNNQRNIYELPNMKPLRAMMSAVANFGDASKCHCRKNIHLVINLLLEWGQMGRQVLREVQLRTWHKQQFREAVIEDTALQIDLIKRLDAFAQPLTRLGVKIPLWSPTRAAIIRKTIELWTYLQAVGGRLTLSHPNIGDDFDEKVHEEPNAEDEQNTGSEPMKISWILRRGFRFEEDTSDGTPREMTVKALVLT